MSSKQVHHITATDDSSRTEVGTVVAFVVSTWCEEDDGSFTVQLSPLAASRLPALNGLELLQAAKGLASASALLPEAVA